METDTQKPGKKPIPIFLDILVTQLTRSIPSKGGFAWERGKYEIDFGMWDHFYNVVERVDPLWLGRRDLMLQLYFEAHGEHRFTRPLIEAKVRHEGPYPSSNKALLKQMDEENPWFEIKGTIDDNERFKTVQQAIEWSGRLSPKDGGYDVRRSHIIPVTYGRGSFRLFGRRNNHPQGRPEDHREKGEHGD